MGFSFVHLADVHFDSPYASRDPAFRTFMRESTRRAFKGAVDLALGEGVNALLIAGDLFDNDTLSFATEKFLINQLNRLKKAGIYVYYSPGNHDPWGSNFRLSQIPWPDNVHIFATSEPKTVRVLDREGNVLAFITSAGHEGKKESRNLAASFPLAEAGDIPHIGLLHTMVTGSSMTGHDRYAPSTLPDLIEKNYTYWALGHVHTRAVLAQNPMIVYPGNLAGRNTRETGSKGAYLVQIDKSGQPRADFHELSPVCWNEIPVGNLADIVDLEGLEQDLHHLIVEYLDEHASGVEPLLKVSLEGRSPLFASLKQEENLETLVDLLKESLNLPYLEICTEGLTRPVDPGKYRRGAHVLNEILSLIDRAKNDEDFLLEMAPEAFADHNRGLDREQKLAYLHSILKDLEYEAVARMVDGDGA